MKKTNLIAISGKKQSGKNLVAKIIRYLTAGADKALISFDKWDGKPVWGIPHKFHHSTWKEKQFAGKVKEMLCLITGCTMQDLENEEFKSSYMSEEWNIWILNFHARPAYREISVSKYELERFANGPGKEMHGSYEITHQKITYRQGLQLIGTDLFRDKFHPQTWVNALFADYQKEECKLPSCTWCPDSDGEENCSKEFFCPNWIITDTRFLNETKAVKDRDGILIRINRPIRHNKGVYADDKQKVEERHLDELNKSVFAHKSETALDNFTDWDYVIDNDSDIESLIEKIREVLIKIKLIC